MIRGLTMNLKAAATARLDLDSDESLVKRAREGDFDAFEVLFDRHRLLVYRFAYQMVNKRDDAEDMVQEAFVRAYQNLHRYRDEAKFTTWLYTIAHNRLVDHWRKRGLQLVSLDQDDPSAAEPPAAADYEPHRMLEAKQTLARFARALEALPPAQREVFLLHHEAELSVAEIALATGANEEAAKSRLRYALSKLKDAVHE